MSSTGLLLLLCGTAVEALAVGPQRACPMGCSGNGECFGGMCLCNYGFTGVDCAEELKACCRVPNYNKKSCTIVPGNHTSEYEDHLGALKKAYGCFSTSEFECTSNGCVYEHNGGCQKHEVCKFSPDLTNATKKEEFINSFPRPGYDRSAVASLTGTSSVNSNSSNASNASVDMSTLSTAQAWQKAAKPVENSATPAPANDPAPKKSQPLSTLPLSQQADVMTRTADAQARIKGILDQLKAKAEVPK